MKKVLIIGYGNFGKLMAEQLSNFLEVFVYDKKKIKLTNNKIKTISENTVKQMDYVVFCVPVQFLEEAINEFKNKIVSETIILDVSSVKVYPLKILKKEFSQNEIIGTHPLFGPESIAKKVPDLKVVISNISGKEKTIKDLKKLIQKLNFQVLEMTAEEHDKQMAHVQALSHFIGFALRDFGLRKDLELKTLAYRRMYALYENVLNDSDELFETIQNYNPYAKNVRKEFWQHLETLDKQLNKV